MKYYLQFKTKMKRRHLWEVFIYLFFGGLATVVNFVIYFFARDAFNLNLFNSNSISWLAAVLFAFVTNKLWVFKSESENFFELIIEFGKFIFYRIVSYGLDMGMMFLFVDSLEIADFWAKLITQVVVVIANYLFSKLFIFKSKDKVV
ncbi:GtrA family protein [Enterococcus sp. MJM12]|uniref:GtrA family protein n=1 Tax=Candidatus Enterococcus myersii TaxID=2815322 RepID=A0ABS3HBX3_9ENTE|nr:GtrA family protein [Enterococcus sp. MJM12]MBO0450464.1 GtrA family protein [Enterococcus sp. MJM12]